MKKTLTQKDVENYISKNYAKSRLYPFKLIDVVYGTYQIYQQVAVIASLGLRNEFEFEDKELSQMISKSLVNLPALNKEQCNLLRVTFPHWEFFLQNVEFGNDYAVNMIHSKFKAAYPFEDKSLKNFYNKLTHWTKENGYSVNVKGLLINSFVVTE